MSVSLCLLFSQAEVVSKVKEELQDPNRKKRRDTKPTNFDDVFEDKGQTQLSARFCCQCCCDFISFFQKVNPDI